MQTVVQVDPDRVPGDEVGAVPGGVQALGGPGPGREPELRLAVDPQAPGLGPAHIGVGAVLLSSLAWSSGTVYARRKLRGVDPIAASAIETSAAGPLMLGIHLLVERGQPVEWGGQAWLAVGYLAVMGSLVGFTAFAYIASHMSSSKVGTYTYVNPVVAVLLGWAFLDEAVTARLVLGGMTILAGLLLVYVARVREKGVPRVRTP